MAPDAKILLTTAIYLLAHICQLSIKASVVTNRFSEREMMCTCKRASRSHGPDLHSAIISVLLIRVVLSSPRSIASNSVPI